MLWEKVTLVGVGLLGGSLGLALRQKRLARTVVGFVRRKASVSECRHAGAVDRATLDLRKAVEQADLVILCTPIAQMLALTRQLLPQLKHGAIVTDVGSVKRGVVRALEPLVAKAGGRFVGSHPMAGSEKAGVRAARADLFKSAICVVTPTTKSNKAAVQQVEQLWRAVGGRPVRMTPALHDALVSRSSHLPHVVAAALANHVLDPARPKGQPVLCANGFRDTTRIASSPPEMWRDIVLANRRNVAKALDSFIADLEKTRDALAKSDLKGLTRFLRAAKQRRDRWCARAASPSPE